MDRVGRGQKVVVGLSGGVDSAVSAWLLKQQGYEVVGIFMKNWEDDDDSAYCSSNADFVDAAAVADVLGIEIEHVNFAAEYRDRVFAEFLREYQAGRTPNPDVLCNAEIKFKAFLDHAVRLGADRIATGHYARVRARPDPAAGSPATAITQYQLLKGHDPSKDQSYFLHRLNQAQLSRTLFPVGGLRKAEVRRIALEIGLPNAGKKDSTGICFIGERPFREFLNRYIAKEPGPIKDATGRVLGQHVGMSFYTLGQRQGLGIGGVRKPALESHVRPGLGSDAISGPSRNGSARNAQDWGSEHDQRAIPPDKQLESDPNLHLPWFVARKDMQSNTLWVVQGHEHPWLKSMRLWALDASWVAGSAPLPGPYAAKSRYRQADAACVLHALDARGFSLAFDAPQWAVTPGQSAVLYDGEVCLGGGIIAGSASPDPAPGLNPQGCGAQLPA